MPCTNLPDPSPVLQPLPTAAQKSSTKEEVQSIKGFNAKPCSNQHPAHFLPHIHSHISIQDPKEMKGSVRSECKSTHIMKHLFTIPSPSQLKHRALAFPRMISKNKAKHTKQPCSHRHSPPLSPPHALSKRPGMYFKALMLGESGWSMKDHAQQRRG